VTAHLHPAFARFGVAVVDSLKVRERGRPANDGAQHHYTGRR
jgi:hypothetical protein